MAKKKDSIWKGEVGQTFVTPEGMSEQAIVDSIKDGTIHLKMVPEATIIWKFSGIARSVEAFDNQGFRNFRILTLHIEEGRVVKIDHSDPYANFEAISRLELANELAILHLNDRWENGRTLSK